MQTLTFPADFKYLDAIRDFVRREAERAGLTGRDAYAVQLAADEACSNVIEYAYAGVSNGQIEVTCETLPGQITVTIHDHGAQFDMSAVPMPNLNGDLDERKVGGLGIYLIHKLMDEVCFDSSEETGNVLIMVKRKSAEK